MNVNPSWFKRLPEIIRIVEEFPEQMLDRMAIEALFDLRIQAAIDAIRQLGGHKLGQSWVISKRTLLLNLYGVREGERFQADTRRRRRVAVEIGHLRENHRARQVVIGTESEFRGQHIEDLPGVLLGKRELRIEHSGHDDLLRKLFGLAQAIAADPVSFEHLLSSANE
jgi:hypothetical protein